MKRSILILAALLATGCASWSRAPQPLEAQQNVLPDIVKPVNTIADPSVEESIAVADNLSDSNALVLTPVADSDPLPVTPVAAVSVRETSIFDALRAIVARFGNDMSLSINFDPAQTGPLRRTVSAFNVHGSFADVIENLSVSSGFYYRYKSGVLIIEPDRQYVVPVPPINELFESMPAMVERLGATEVLLDKSLRALTFRASRSVYDKVSSYLSYIRNTRSMITYDCYIWEVNLNDSSQMGINWTALPTNTTAGGAAGNGVVVSGSGQSSSFAVNVTNAASIAGGTGVGFLLSAPHIAMSVLADFLRTQGTVNNISQPKLAMLSGGSALFRNGTDQDFIQSISPGTLINGAWIAGSVQSSTLHTGVTMTINGDLADGTVWTDLDVKIRVLTNSIDKPVSVNQGANTTITLNTTSDREVTTKVRGRPGDAIVIGGINVQTVTDQTNGIASAATNANKAVVRSELVVILVPKVTHFVGKKKG